MKQFWTITAVLLIIVCESAFSQSFKAPSSCPDGSQLVLDKVCVSKNLDETSVLPNTYPGECARSSYATPPGLDFCLVKNKVSLSQLGNGHYFVEGPIDRNCDKKGFFWWQNHDICLHENFALTLKGENLKLSYPKLECPEGYEHRTGFKSCVAVNTPKEESDRSGLLCPIGFMKPEWVQICLQNAIAFETLRGFNYGGYKAPEKACTKHNSKPDGGFCIPTKRVEVCGAYTFPCENKPGDTFKVLDGPGECGNTKLARVISLPPLNTTNSASINTQNLIHRTIMCGPSIKQPL